MKPYRKAHAMLVAAGFLLAGSEMKAVYKPKNGIAQEDVLLRVYLVGHGAAYRNVPHPADMTAQKLDSLRPSGLEQAAEAGQILRGKAISAMIASPTGQTRQTAEAITEALGPHEGRYTDMRTL